MKWKDNHQRPSVHYFVAKQFFSQFARTKGGGGGVWIPPKNDDVIYEQPLIKRRHTRYIFPFRNRIVYFFLFQIWPIFGDGGDNVLKKFFSLKILSPLDSRIWGPNLKLSSGHPGFIKSVLRIWHFFKYFGKFWKLWNLFWKFWNFFVKMPDIFDKVGKITNLMSMMNIVKAVGAEDNRILPSENS